MLEKHLKIIYDDYYNLKRTVNIMCDRDIIEFVYFLSKQQHENNVFEDIISKYKNQKKDKYEQYINFESFDDFFSERHTLHFTYPFYETFKRLDVLYEMIGKKQWEEIFGYSYELLYYVVTVIICRIVLLYNNYRKINDITKRKEYEKIHPYSTTCYFTKEEIYSFFNGYQTEIDRVLDDISIDFYKQDRIKDACSILQVDNHYYLFFIWDFLYNLFDKYSKKIKSSLGNDDFNNKRGKIFENLCYNNLKNTFPQFKIYKSLEYDYNKGNHEIDLLIQMEETIIVFECKSSSFDTYESSVDGKLYNDFRKAYGRGYKTINDLNNYIKLGNNIFRTKDGNNVSFDFNKYKVVYVNLSLYNIEYLQTNVQKIEPNKINPVEVYPICWNYIDFLTLTKVAYVDYKLFETYFNKRFNMINKNKNLTFDYDEIDVFGFLTDPSYQDFYTNALMPVVEKGNSIDMNFMISNGAYRKEFNKCLDIDYLYGFIEQIKADD